MCCADWPLGREYVTSYFSDKGVLYSLKSKSISPWLKIHWLLFLFFVFLFSEILLVLRWNLCEIVLWSLSLGKRTVRTGAFFLLEGIVMSFPISLRTVRYHKKPPSGILKKKFIAKPGRKNCPSSEGLFMSLPIFLITKHF